MYAPFLAPMFDLPIVVEVKEKSGEILFGLFGGEEKLYLKRLMDISLQKKTGKHCLQL